DMRVAALALHAAPTLDEIARFAGDGGDGDGDSAAAIAALATAAAAADIGGPAEARDLAPGDGVEVVDGDMAGAVGVVSSIDGAVVRVDVAALRGGSGGSGMGFAAHQLRKRFAPGDHVKVLAGRHRGATGMVLDASAAVVAVLADVGGAELRVLARDLRVSSDVSAPSGGAGGAVQAVVGLDVHDLVLLDGGQPAVVTRVAADALTVLDDRGETRSVAPRDARPARASSDRAGVDCAGAPLRRGDAVREISGARRDGAVLQVTRFVAFVLPRGGSGLFVARTRQLEPAAPRAAPRTMGPPQALAAGARGGRGGGRGGGSARGGRGGGRDALVGRTVVATRGPYKGYIGMAKDATGDSVRVELHTNARIVSIDRDKLAVRLPSGDTVPAVDFGASAAAPPPPPAAAANGWAAPPPPRADARSPAPAYGGWGDARSPAPAPAASASSAWHTPAGTGAAASSWGTPAATASGWGDASAATLASSGGGWGDAMAATPASSGGGWGDAAPQSSVAPATPAGGGLPQTPGGPFPQTPGATTTSSSSGGGGDNAFFAWAVPRAVVVLGSTRQRGTLTEVAAARAQAIVRLADGSTQVIDRSSLPRLDPQPMRAEKRDRVIVIRGPRRGATGSMVGRDGSEAFFQPDGDSAWHPEPLRNLAVYDDNKR
ncbi:transcription elongation factor spt5, partial [Coemansia sp. RSA 2681]